MNSIGNENELQNANNYVDIFQISRHKWKPITEVPAIFFAKVGAAVMLNRKRLVQYPFLLDNNTMAYSFEKGIWNISFGKSLFETIDLTSLVQVGALPSYNASDVEDIKIFLPSLPEQARIGTFFRQLDRLITLHQCNCNMATRPYEWSSGLRAIAWEQREFKNLFKILPNNTLSRAELSFEKGIVKNLHYGDILIKFNEILDSCDKKIPFISREMNFEKIKNAILKNGDVVIADAAEDEAVGKCTEIFNISQNEQIISGLHTIPCRPNIDFAQGFLGYYMNSNSYHSQLVPLMQGIKVLSLSKSSLQDTLITFPRTKKEQARIGTFFRHLDRLITLHQRKHILLT